MGKGSAHGPRRLPALAPVRSPAPQVTKVTWGIGYPAGFAVQWSDGTARRAIYLPGEDAVTILPEMRVDGGDIDSPCASAVSYDGVCGPCEERDCVHAELAQALFSEIPASRLCEQTWPDNIGFGTLVSPGCAATILLQDGVRERDPHFVVAHLKDRTVWQFIAHTRDPHGQRWFRQYLFKDEIAADPGAVCSSCERMCVFPGMALTARAVRAVRDDERSLYQWMDEELLVGTDRGDQPGIRLDPMSEIRIDHLPVAGVPRIRTKMARLAAYPQGTAVVKTLADPEPLWRVSTFIEGTPMDTFDLPPDLGYCPGCERPDCFHLEIIRRNAEDW